MVLRVKVWHCPKCAISIPDSHGGPCPLCGTPLIEEVADQEQAQGIHIGLVFPMVICDACGQRSPTNDKGVCPRCGRHDPDFGRLEPAAQHRREVLGQRVAALAAETGELASHELRFSQRGARPEFAVYVQQLTDLYTTRPLELMNRGIALLNETDWTGSDAALDDGFTEFEAVVRSLGACVGQMVDAPAPPALLTLHRQIARAVAALTNAMTAHAELLIATRGAEMIEKQRQGQRLLDEGTEHLQGMGELIARRQRIASEPGWFSVEAEFDPGRVAWELLDQRAASVAGAAQIVREVFADPAVDSLSDSYAALLLPGAISASFHDPVRLRQRLSAAKRLLEAADNTDPSWIREPSALVDEFVRGSRLLSQQAGLFGATLRAMPPRRALLDGLLSTYGRFVEGPFRHLGRILAVAALVPRGQGDVLEQASLENLQAGDVFSRLQTHAGSLASDINLVIRHAEAHCDFEFTETTVKVTNRNPHTGQVSQDELTDDDLLEQVLNLNELLIAMQAAVAPWLWSSVDPRLQGALASHGQDLEAAKEVTRFLLGLRGWVEVVFERLNDQMHVTGRYMGDPQSNPFLEALSAFAPFFTIFPNVSALVIRIVGDPRELNLERSDSRQVGMYGPQATLHEVALTTRKVRAATEPVEAAKLDAQYVLFPAAWSLAEALLSWLQAANDADRLSALRGYLRWLNENYPKLQVVDELIPLRQDLTEIINAITTDLIAFQAATRQRNQPWLARLRASLGQRGVSLVTISNACRAIFQSSAS
jgi:hypothetical protein